MTAEQEELFNKDLPPDELVQKLKRKEKSVPQCSSCAWFLPKFLRSCLMSEMNICAIQFSKQRARELWQWWEWMALNANGIKRISDNLFYCSEYTVFNLTDPQQSVWCLSCHTCDESLSSFKIFAIFSFMIRTQGCHPDLLPPARYRHHRHHSCRVM